MEQTQQTNDAERRELKKLQSENDALKQQLPDAPWSIWKLYAAASKIATAGVAGVLIGALLVAGGNNFAIMGSTLDTASVTELQRRTKALDSQELRIKDENAELMANKKRFADYTAQTQQAFDATEKKLLDRYTALSSREKENNERAGKLVRNTSRTVGSKRTD